MAITTATSSNSQGAFERDVDGRHKLFPRKDQANVSHIIDIVDEPYTLVASGIPVGVAAQFQVSADRVSWQDWKIHGKKVQLSEAHPLQWINFVGSFRLQLVLASGALYIGAAQPNVHAYPSTTTHERDWALVDPVSPVVVSPVVVSPVVVSPIVTPLVQTAPVWSGIQSPKNYIGGQNVSATLTGVIGQATITPSFGGSYVIGTLQSGSLPPGLSLAVSIATGVAELSGTTANTTGTYTFTVRATNAVAPLLFTDYTFTVQVNAVTTLPTWTNTITPRTYNTGETISSMSAGQLGVANSNTGAQVTVTLQSGALPPGMTLTTNFLSGSFQSISGTAPLVSGVYNFVLRNANATFPALFADQAFTVNIVPAPVVAPVVPVVPVYPSWSNISPQYPYVVGQTLLFGPLADLATAASNTAANITVTLQSGALPAGIFISAGTFSSPKNVTLGGTFAGPAGVSNFVLRAANALNPLIFTDQAFVVNVNAAPVVVSPVVTPTPPVWLSNSNITVATNATLVFTGNGQLGTGQDSTAPFTNVSATVISGSLPPGTSLATNASTNNPFSVGLNGTAPSAAGTYSFTVRLQDAVTGLQANQAFTVTVSSSVVFTPPTWASSGSIALVVGTPVAFNGAGQLAVVTDNTAPFLDLAITLLSGSLPLGTTLDNNANSTNPSAVGLVGTPTTVGTYVFTVRVFDPVSGLSVNGSITATVTAAAAPPTLTSSGVVSYVTGTALVFNGNGQLATASDSTSPVLDLVVSLVSGTLPPGTSLDNNSNSINPSAVGLVGTVGSIGTYVFTIRVTDPITLLTADATITATVTAAAVAPTLTSSGSVSYVTGTALAFNGNGQLAVATDNTSPMLDLAVSLVSGSLPPGTSLDNNSNSINPSAVGLVGTVGAVGVYVFTIRVTDPITLLTADTTITATVTATAVAPTWSAASFATTYNIGDALVFNTSGLLGSVTDNTSPFNNLLIGLAPLSGALPPGLSVQDNATSSNPASAGVTGTVAGFVTTYSVILRATDPVSGLFSDVSGTINVTNVVSPVVSPSGTPPAWSNVITPLNYTVGEVVGISHPNYVVATATTAPVTSVNTSISLLSGVLPTGLSLFSSFVAPGDLRQAEVTGTVGAAGSGTFTLRVTDTVNSLTTDQVFNWAIAAAATPPVWSGVQTYDYFVGENPNASLKNIIASVTSVSGHTITLVGGALPTTLSLAATVFAGSFPFQLSTTNTVSAAPGAYTYTLRAAVTSNPLIFTDQVFTANVFDPPTWTFVSPDLFKQVGDTAADPIATALAPSTPFASTVVVEYESGAAPTGAPVLPDGPALSATATFDGTYTAVGVTTTRVKATDQITGAVIFAEVTVTVTL